VWRARARKWSRFTIARTPARWQRPRAMVWCAGRAGSSASHPSRSRSRRGRQGRDGVAEKCRRLERFDVRGAPLSDAVQRATRFGLREAHVLDGRAARARRRAATLVDESRSAARRGSRRRPARRGDSCARDARSHSTGHVAHLVGPRSWRQPARPTPTTPYPPSVASSSSSWSNVSPVPHVLPEAMASSRASFEG
jgi:hypothetical protein